MTLHEFTLRSIILAARGDVARPVRVAPVVRRSGLPAVLAGAAISDLAAEGLLVLDVRAGSAEVTARGMFVAVDADAARTEREERQRRREAPTVRPPAFRAAAQG